MHEIITEEPVKPVKSPAAKNAEARQKNNELHLAKTKSIADATAKLPDVEPSPENPMAKVDAIAKVNAQRQAETIRNNSTNHRIAASTKKAVTNG
jgi:hypothetical protein